MQAEGCHSHAGVQECNEQESILAWPSLARPSFTFATSLIDMLGVGTGSIGAQVECTMLSLGCLNDLSGVHLSLEGLLTGVKAVM